MTNPMLQMLQPKQSNNSMLSELMRSNNPQQFVTNMLMKNSNASQVINMIQQCGGSPKQAFYKLAQSKGIDANDFLKQFK